MRKFTRNFITIIVVVLMMLQMSVVAFAATNIPAATADFYVNDFAGVFSEEEKTRLMDNAVALSNDHDGIQVVVSTITSLEDSSIEDYAVEMYNQYGIGKDDMGLLILLSTGDRQIRVEVGLAMEAYINDSKAGRFIDKYAIPSLKENKFNEGLINLQEAFVNEIVSVTENENAKPVQTSEPKSGLNFMSFLGTILMILAVVGVIILIIALICKIIAKIRERKEEIASLTRQLEESKRDVANARKQADQDRDVLERQINNLSREKKQWEAKYQKLTNAYETLKDRYRRAETLYPRVDKDVTDMIKEEIRQKDIKAAQEVDAIIMEVINLPPDKDRVSALERAKSSYSKLTCKQRRYVKSDILKLDLLYENSLKLKEEYERQKEEERLKGLAKAAVTSIVAIISCISVGKASNFRQLRDAKSIYDNLNSNARKYFDQSVADKLDRLYRQAKRDKEVQEENERRERQRRQEEDEARRRRQQSSHSSFGSSSHHGGFGGHSGGGGASRGF